MLQIQIEMSDNASAQVLEPKKDGDKIQIVNNLATVEDLLQNLGFAMSPSYPVKEANFLTIDKVEQSYYYSSQQLNVEQIDGKNITSETDIIILIEDEQG